LNHILREKLAFQKAVSVKAVQEPAWQGLHPGDPITVEPATAANPNFKSLFQLLEF